MEQINAATKQDAKTSAERKRIPMSTPVQKLEVPDIPGYHLHWFRSWEPGRIDRALAGGYEFVYDKDIRVNSVGLGADTTKSGNTDLGSQVSIVGGGGAIDSDGQPGRLILMKLKQEYWEADNKERDGQSGKVVDALTAGMVGAEKEVGGDARQRYVDRGRTALPDFFKAKRPK